MQEDFLETNYGKQRPFKVPEGYFDGFADRMMDLLPEPSAKIVPMRKSRWSKLRPYAIAASFCAILGGAGILYFHHEDTEPQQISQTQEASIDYTIDQMADYAMLDNSDFYSYLANE